MARSIAARSLTCNVLKEIRCPYTDPDSLTASARAWSTRAMTEPPEEGQKPEPVVPPAAVPAAFLNTDAFPGFAALLRKMETSIGLPPKFVDDLLNEDDWSFTIKMHALLEAALTALLVETLGDQDTSAAIRKIVGRIPMSEKHTGKVEWAVALQLLSKDDRDFAVLLSEFRNVMAHRIEMVGTTLSQYVASVDSNKRKWILSIIAPHIIQMTLKANNRATQDTLKNPKPALWLRGTMLLIQISVARFRLVLKRPNMTDAERAETFKLVMDLGQDIMNLLTMIQEGLKLVNQQYK